MDRINLLKKKFDPIPSIITIQRSTDNTPVDQLESFNLSTYVYVNDYLSTFMIFI